MKNTVNLLFEAAMLGNIHRTGFAFLGTGKESVAAHSFTTTFIAYVLSAIEPVADRLRLITMCLVHDLPEARIGDLNSVQKKYVTADEEGAVRDAIAHLPFETDIADLIREFNQGETREARLAHDADQLSFILRLKALSDVGHVPSEKWLSHVQRRLKTKIAQKLAVTIMETGWDDWWMNNYVDRPEIKT